MHSNYPPGVTGHEPQITGEPDTTTLGLDAHTTLKTITECAESARAALADEHEGDFTEAVEVLAEHAAALLALVRAW